MIVLSVVSTGLAQTTLSGDHVVDGDLTVGTSSNKSKLVINGETGSTANPGLSLTGDGGAVFGGTYGTGTLPVSGSGAFMVWYPGKAAFRAGYFSGTSALQDSSIGAYSIAGGNGGRALGLGAVAFSAQASGVNSFAISEGASTGKGATSMSHGYAEGEFSAAIAFSYSYGRSSFAAAASLAWAEGSAAIGGGEAGASLAAGLSMGAAYGTGSTAMSAGYAIGDYSTAAGFSAMAASFGAFAIGRYNLDGGSSTEWVDTDPLVTVGNGTGDPADPPEVQNRNVLTIYKNGKIKMDRQGDILMGEFGNPE